MSSSSCSRVVCLLACSMQRLGRTCYVADKKRKYSLVCLTSFIRGKWWHWICEHTFGRYNTTYYNRLHYRIGCPCFTVFFVNTTRSALSHRPQLTSDTTHTITPLHCACPFSCYPAAQVLQPEHWNQKKSKSNSQGGRRISHQASASPSDFLSHHHFLSLQDLPFMVVLPVKLPSFFFSSFLLAIFHSERLSCDLLYIFSIRMTIFLFFQYSYICYIFE